MSISLIGVCTLFAVAQCEIYDYLKSSKYLKNFDSDKIFDFDYRLLPREKRTTNQGFSTEGEEKTRPYPAAFEWNIERPNKYHRSLPLPSPFISAVPKVTRAKRMKKSDKILSRPLFFTYNPEASLITKKQKQQSDVNKPYETEETVYEEDNSSEQAKEEYYVPKKHIQKIPPQLVKTTVSERGLDNNSFSESKTVDKIADSETAEQKHHKGPSKHKKGGEKEHHSDHFAKGGEEGKKKYEAEHKYEKHEVGHHDKEGHKGKYKDHGGKKKKSHKEDGYFGGHKAGEEGEKGAEFKENGKHNKGHSTKGEHNIHKKEEYEKTKHFYDESHEEGEHEKHGGYHHENSHKKGGKYKKGHFNKDYEEKHYGKKGKHSKGSHFHETDGHKDAGGHDKHYKHKSHYGKKHGDDVHKKYGYKNSHKG